MTVRGSVQAGTVREIQAPTAADFLAYAALMNGRCPKCERILPHKDSGKTHDCAAVSPVAAGEER